MTPSPVLAAGFVCCAAAHAQPLVFYSVETHAVNTFERDAANGTEVTFYDGGDATNLLTQLGAQETVINPGQSLVLRVSMSMPGHNQTFPGSGTLLLSSFGTATFDLSLANAQGGVTTAGAAPLSTTLYPLGVLTDWEDLVENFDPGTPNEAVFGPDSITSIVPAQVPPFTLPINSQGAPWVVDLIWTPSTYAERTVTWSLSDARDAFVWMGTAGVPGNSWVDFPTSIDGVSGDIAIVPAPASLAVIGLAGLALRRSRPRVLPQCLCRGDRR